jgi:predicted RNA-binding Zn-ribbon protein involved in translation (DUF1610 family)
VLNVVCGNCGNTIPVREPDTQGLLQFQCPICGTTNQIHYHKAKENDLPPGFEISYPAWWQKIPTKDDNMQLLPATKEQLHAIQALMDRTWKGVITRDRKDGQISKFKVVQVQQNHNPRLWRNYCVAREMVRRQMAQANEDLGGRKFIDAKSGSKFEVEQDGDAVTFQINASTPVKVGRMSGKTLTVNDLQGFVQDNGDLLWNDGSHWQLESAFKGDKLRALTWDVQKEDAETFDCLGDEDVSVNEFMLFHGTKPAACESICKSDFMVNLAGSNAGTLYGNGIYFGESSSKSDEYAKQEEEGIYSGLCAMLLCRVTCGRMWYTDKVNPNHDDIERYCMNPETKSHNCVVGDREQARGTYREFVVFDNDLAYPEYIVIYKRVSSDDNNAA